MRRNIGLAVLAFSLACVPVACLFPDYVADVPPGGAGGAGDASTSRTTGTRSSTTTSADGGASAGGGGSRTSSGEGGGAHCVDGKDDNGDGKVDCADPACASFVTCAPEAPEGFQGPARVISPIVGATPSCDEGWSVSTPLFADLVAPDATCGCACQPPAAVCSASGQEYTDLACAIPGGTLTDIPAGSCKSNPGGTVSSVSITGAVVASGMCAAVPSVDKMDATFTTQGLACSASRAKGCAAGNVCVPKPGPGFSDHLCVIAPGDVGCPGSYPNKQTFFDAATVDDQRKCTPTCACGSLTADCDGAVTFFSNPNCHGSAAPARTGSCADVSPARYKSVSYAPDDPQPSCPVTAMATATGMASPKGKQTTVCCD